jgi:hypothetical protein
MMFAAVLLVLSMSSPGSAQQRQVEPAPVDDAAGDGAGNSQGQRLVVEVPPHTVPIASDGESSGILPRTGSALGRVVALAAGLILAGCLATLAGRRISRAAGRGRDASTVVNRR